MDRATASAPPRTGTRIYLYGGRNQGALVQLALNLRQRYPGLQIVGGYSPPFRALDRRRGARASSTRSTRSGADVVWVGIGVPKQEKWMARDARPRSTRRCWSASAPRSTSTPGWSRRRRAWMQRIGLEWAVPARAASRGGCGGATCATTRASSPASRASTRAAHRRRAPLASSAPHVATTSPIIGLGRVGLPLALSLRRPRPAVLGIDNDPERLAAVARRRACRSRSPAPGAARARRTPPAG